MTQKRQHPICNTVGCNVAANWVHKDGIGASCDYHKNEWYTIEIDQLDFDAALVSVDVDSRKVE